LLALRLNQAAFDRLIDWQDPTVFILDEIILDENWQDQATLAAHFQPPDGKRVLQADRRDGAG
jgi:quinol monooxygenase YgiN